MNDELHELDSDEITGEIPISIGGVGVEFEYDGEKYMAYRGDFTVHVRFNTWVGTFGIGTRPTHYYAYVEIPGPYVTKIGGDKNTSYHLPGQPSKIGSRHINITTKAKYTMKRERFDSKIDIIAKKGEYTQHFLCLEELRRVTKETVNRLFPAPWIIDWGDDLWDPDLKCICKDCNK